MGYEKEAYLYLLFHYTGKKDFQESTPKIQMLMIGLAQTSHFGLWDIIHHLIDFNFYQNNRQRYTMIPITTVRGPSEAYNISIIQWAESKSGPMEDCLFMFLKMGMDARKPVFRVSD